MRSSKTFFRMLICSVVLLAHGTARAGEDDGTALRAPLVQAEVTDAFHADAAAGHAQALQSIVTEIELVTGDGQQASASTRSAACDDHSNGCTQ